MHRLISVALGLALALPAVAQPDKPLAFDDVLKLVQLGFADAEVLAELARTHTTLAALTPAQLDALKAAGAGESLLAALRPKAAEDPVAQVIAAHREGKSAAFLVERILQAKLSPQPLSALTPAIQAGVPHGALLALRGTPLSASDVTTLATRGAGEDELLLLAKGIGLGFALDPKTSLELTKSGVPVAWLVRLRGLAGTAPPVRQDPPTPTDPPVRPDPPTPTDPPVAPGTLVTDPGLSDAGLAFLDAIDSAFVHLAKGEHARAEPIARAQLDVARELGPWALHSALSALAWAQLGQGRIDDGLAALERTITLGSIDFEGIHVIVPAAQLAHPRLKALYAAMRVRRVEHAEYLWHRKAQQQLGHETRMMITENMNRPDSDYTQVPDFPIPDHAVASPDVILGRMYLRRTILSQRRTVQTSDISRINHLLQMKVIRSSGSASDPAVERRREEEIVQSRRDAEQRCAQRARRYADLAFAPPADGGQTLLAPPLGTVDVSWLRDQVAAVAKAAAPEGTGSGEPTTPAPVPGGDPNPLARAKVGDWVQLRITRTLGEERQQETVISKVVSVGAGTVKTQVTNEAGQSVDDESPLKPTLQEQLLQTFAQQGRMRVLSYKVTAASFEANGGTLPGRRVALALEITTEAGASRVDAVYEIADAVPMLGVLRAELRFANGLVALVECVGCGRARD